MFDFYLIPLPKPPLILPPENPDGLEKEGVLGAEKDGLEKEGVLGAEKDGLEKEGVLGAEKDGLSIFGDENEGERFPNFGVFIDEGTDG